MTSIEDIFFVSTQLKQTKKLFLVTSSTKEKRKDHKISLEMIAKDIKKEEIQSNQNKLKMRVFRYA